MLVAGGLGFQSLVLVVCLVVPVIGFVVRRKWRFALARNEEIKRLLALAAEEAARIEASAEYGVFAAVPQNQCAICYFPTTTRCSRCKAVRYCSFKCQIFHWRQGHREECRPACLTQTVTDIGRDSSQKGKEEEHSEVCSENYDGTKRAKPIEAFPSKPAYESHGCSAEVLYEKDDGSEVESIASGKGMSATSESCSTPFSGFSTSSSNSELADDVSVSESISSVDTEGSDGHLYFDTASDELHTTSNVKDEDKSEPLSPKFASLVDSVNGISVSKLSKMESSCNEGENQCQPTCSSRPSNSSVRDGPTKPCASSTGFWEKALDSVGPPVDIPDDDDTFNSSGLVSSKVSGGTSLHFSFNLSRSTSPPLCTKGFAEEVTLPKDAPLDGLRVKKHTDGSSLSENIDYNASKIMGCQSSNHEAFKNWNNKCASISPNLNSREAQSMRAEGGSKYADSSNVNMLPSTKAQKLDHVVSNNSKTSNPLKSEEGGYSLSGTYLASGTKDSSIERSKVGADAGQDGATASSQVLNYPNVRNGLKTSVQNVVEQFRGSKLSKQYPLGLGSEIVGRYSDKGIFPYDSFVKLYNWNKVELRPSGLINCGNSCYANAVLQCLAFTPPLTAYFLQGIHSKDCVKKKWCFTCEFESLILKAKEGKSPLSPIGIVSQLQNIGSQLGNGREEDAHEFLRYAIDTMQSICLAEARVGSSGHLEEQTTLIGLTFGGYLRSKIKCMKCQGRSERQEGMMDLTVEIEGDIGSLEEALRKFTSTEMLDGENKYHCSRCKSYEKAKKKLTILEAPNVLTIALKRFQSGKFGKLNKAIRFPEILNLAPFMSGTSDKLAIYRLYGVVVHLDVMNAAFSGHYVCYVKNAHNKWFKIDDSTVTAVDLEKVLSKGAYMLLYARCSPRAPRLIRNRIVSSDPKARVTPSWMGGKTTALKSKSTSNPSVAQFLSSSNPPGGSSSYDLFYARYNRLQRILEEDSSSDNSSLISNNSDEGSCSTDSTRDSTSIDDLSDYIFGDSVRVWNSPLEELL